MLDLFCEENKLCTVRSYCSEQFIAGNKTEKSSDEPPTDQEHRPGDRADQTHRVQLTDRIIFFGCLIFGGDHKSIFVFVYCCSSGKFYFKVVYSCHITAVVVCAVDRICSNAVCLY